MTGHSSLPTPVGSVPEVIKSSFHTEGETNKRGRRKGTGQSILRKHRSQEASNTKRKGHKKREKERILTKRQENDRQNYRKECWGIVLSAAVHSLTLTTVNNGD